MMKYFIKKFSCFNLAIIFIHILTLWKTNSNLYSDGRPIDDDDDGGQLQNSRKTDTVSDTREIVMIRFPLGEPQAKKRLRRSPSNNHVVEIFRPKNNETIVLQISKSYSLLSPDFRVQINPDFEQEETNDTENSSVISKEDLVHCIYSGEVVVSNPGQESGGQVALSACDLGNSDFSGFTGLITTNDGHWILEPEEHHYDLKQAKIDDDATAHSFPHSMQRAVLPSTRRCSSGNFHRPPSNSDNDDDDDDENLIDHFDSENEVSQQGDDESDAVQKSEIIENVLTAAGDDDDENGQINVHPLTIIDGVVDTDDDNNNNFKIASKTKKKVNSKAKKKQGRLLELAIFSDSLLYDKMKKTFPKNTLKSVSNYITAQVNNMKLLYKDPSIGPGNEIDIKLTYLEIQTKPVGSLKTGKGKESIYLKSFCDFAAARKSASRNLYWDHAMCLTGADLRDEKSNGVLGVAWTAAMCDKKYSCSLIEASSFIGSYTMTHELGHSLGMNHDGEENNLECSPTDYIMAAYAGPGQTTWSTCSENNLKDYLAGKSSVKDASKPKCLKRSSSRKKRRPVSKGKFKFPGEIYTPTQQCALYLGKKIDHKPIMTNVYPYDNICRELYCGNDTHPMPTHPALEGTSCDTSKWCKSGKCVSKPS